MSQAGWRHDALCHIGCWLDEASNWLYDKAGKANRVEQPEYRIPYEDNPYSVDDETLYLAQLIWDADPTWDDEGVIDFRDAVERDLCASEINHAAAVIDSGWAPR